MTANRPLHPLLFTVYPILSLASTTPSQVSAADVGIPYLIAAAAAIGALLVAKRIYRDEDRAARACSAAIWNSDRTDRCRVSTDLSD